MTATKDVTVWCDGRREPGAAPRSCGEWSMGDTATDERQALRRAGWHSLPGGRDLCPACWAEGQR